MTFLAESGAPPTVSAASNPASFTLRFAPARAASSMSERAENVGPAAPSDTSISEVFSSLFCSKSLERWRPSGSCEVMFAPAIGRSNEGWQSSGCWGTIDALTGGICEWCRAGASGASAVYSCEDEEGGASLVCLPLASAMRLTRVATRSTFVCLFVLSLFFRTRLCVQLNGEGGVYVC